MNNNSSFDATRHTLMEFVLFYQVSCPIILPVEFKVIIDLVIERVRQRIVMTETSKHSSPVVEFESHFINWLVGVLVLNNFTKGS